MEGKECLQEEKGSILRKREDLRLSMLFLNIEIDGVERGEVDYRDVSISTKLSVIEGAKTQKNNPCRKTPD